MNRHPLAPMLLPPRTDVPRKETPAPDTQPAAPKDDLDRARLEGEIDAFTMVQWLIKDQASTCDCVRVIQRAIDARRARLSRKPTEFTHWATIEPPKP
jgi:hypothetical protein